MPAPSGKVPVVASARAGLDFVRTHWRALTPGVFGGVGAILLISLLGASAAQSPALAFLTLLLQAATMTAAYALFLGIALKEPGERRGALGPDAVRLAVAMTIIGLFLLLLFLVVVLLPGGLLMSAYLEPYRAAAGAAADNPEQMSAVMRTAYTDNPIPVLLVAIVFAAIFVALTSRLYMVAPATVAENRIRTFDTWPWTQGAMLRVSGARLLLLAPANLLLLFLLQAGANLASSPLGAVVVTIALFGSMIVLALEAGLSAFLYRGLKPPAS